MGCMNRVYLRGCEAKYLEPLLGTSDFCEKKPASSRRLDQSGGDTEDRPGQEVPGASGAAALAGTPPRIPASDSARSTARSSRTSLRQSSSSTEGPDLSLSTKTGGYDGDNVSGGCDRDAEGSAGSLVIHMRSGDIFRPSTTSRAKGSFWLHTMGQVRRRPHALLKVSHETRV